MRRDLRTPIVQVRFPAGTSLRTFTVGDAGPLHALLADAYADGGGEVEPFDVWWPALREDAEFSADLCFLAVDETGALVGAAQCWTSAFIKDLVVARGHRGCGVGSALLAAVFASFAVAGAPFVSLKVRPDNDRAIALYQRRGMQFVCES